MPSAPAPKAAPASSPKPKTDPAPKKAVTGSAKGDAVLGAAQTYASSKPARGAKPSTTRKVAGGAAAGAATGAALGSVIPGVGTAIGAGAGAVVGGAGGALKGHSEKKAWKAAARGDGAGARRALIAEFAICIVILALSPVVHEKGAVQAKDWMKRGSAMCALFILLGMVSAAGPRAARVSVAIGGLITLVLLLDQREVFQVLTSKLKTTESVGRRLDPPSGGAAAGGVADDAAAFLTGGELDGSNESMPGGTVDPGGTIGSWIGPGLTAFWRNG